MGSTTGMYATRNDLVEFEKFVVSNGLTVIAPTVNGVVSEDPVDGPFAYLSLVPKSELHPYGKPPIQIADVKDPLVRYMRPYFKAPYLVGGHIYWNNDVRALAEKTKPFYQKLSQWIKKHWSLPPERSFYAGPEAIRLIGEGAEMVNFLPSTISEHIIVRE